MNFCFPCAFLFSRSQHSQHVVIFHPKSTFLCPASSLSPSRFPLPQTRCVPTGVADSASEVGSSHGGAWRWLSSGAWHSEQGVWRQGDQGSIVQRELVPLVAPAGASQRNRDVRSWGAACCLQAGWINLGRVSRASWMNSRSQKPQ